MATYPQRMDTSLGNTFRIRIKIDSKEATGRLGSLQRKIGCSRSDATALIQMVDLDGTLSNELLLADNQILTTIELLRLADVGEREYLARGIMMVEAWFTKLRVLLRQVDKSISNVQEVPSGCYLQASALARELYLQRAVLFRLRKAFEKEFDLPDAEPRATLLDSLAKRLEDLAEWFHVPDQAVPTLEHREMEHIYSSGWCQCKDYI